MVMFNRNKVVTVGSISSFMDGSWKMTTEEKQTLGIMGVATMITAFSAKEASASGISEKIMHAFDPIIELVQGLSYPVAFLFLAGGMLLVMMGQRHKGLQMIKWAGIGYIGMQLVPALMAMLVEVGRLMK